VSLSRIWSVGIACNRNPRCSFRMLTFQVKVHICRGTQVPSVICTFIHFLFHCSKAEICRVCSFSFFRLSWFVFSLFFYSSFVCLSDFLPFLFPPLLPFFLNSLIFSFPLFDVLPNFFLTFYSLLSFFLFSFLPYYSTTYSVTGVHLSHASELSAQPLRQTTSFWHYCVTPFHDTDS
jgi:hypothetical protein